MLGVGDVPELVLPVGPAGEPDAHLVHIRPMPAPTWSMVAQFSGSRGTPPIRHQRLPPHDHRLRLRCDPGDNHATALAQLRQPPRSDRSITVSHPTKSAAAGTGPRPGRSAQSPREPNPLVKEAVQNLMPWHGSETPGARPTCRSPVGSPAAAVFALRWLRQGNSLT